MTTTELIAHYCHYAAGPEWTHELRRSVRLQLALSEPGLNLDAVLAALRLVELDLCQKLLASDPASADSPEAVDTVIIVVQLYQTTLLNHPAECETLRRTMPVTEFMPVLGPICNPQPASNSSWLLST